MSNIATRQNNKKALQSSKFSSQRNSGGNKTSNLKNKENYDKIVSVRMPSSLVQELKVMSDKNHYLDVSETIRSLLRQKWLSQKSPVKSKVFQLKRKLSKITEHDQIESLKNTIKLLEDLNEL